MMCVRDIRGLVPAEKVGWFMSWQCLFSRLVIVSSIVVVASACPPPPPEDPECGCEDLPEDPMCGPDGRTYVNECRVICAGVEVEDVVPCEPGCRDSDDCEAGEYCDLGGECEGPGTCTPMPQACGRVYRPHVCDCDGNVYDSVCEANMSRASAVVCPESDPIPQ
jgi:hypothetical protein